MKKVIIRLIFILAFVNSQAFAQKESFEEFDTAADEFSDKYMAGPHLIYDCEDKHWVCVADYEKKVCDESREKITLEKKRDLKCTYFKSFKDKKECFNYQLSVITNAVDPAWTCTVPNWRFQDIKFE